jgi:intracellular sulfur oxidation DsrE/DsrF family protein
MKVIISENQEDRLKSAIKEIVEDIKVPLSIKVDVVFSSTGATYVLIPLKNYLMSKVRTKYESLIRNKIKNYIGLDVEVIMMEKSDIDS